MKTYLLASGVLLSIPLAFGQAASSQPSNDRSAPIYHVTVVQRTTKAVNYQYRTGPTQIDFRGTVLIPQVKGNAWVESKKGRTEIDATIDHLQTPQRFGREYLTYVLWAITPEGHPHNLGELVLDGEKAKLHVTTGLQAFALIVTAEPYSAVRQPSDVVVAENQIREDTAGRVESVDAKYELLPRGQYTWNPSGSVDPAVANAPKVSSGEYDTLVQLYQAQNAVAIASSAGAERYAPDTLARAQQLLQDAQSLHSKKGNRSRIIEDAREAAQTAEDARVIAMQRQQEEKLRTASAEVSQAQAEAAAAQQAKQQAEAEAERARAEAQQARGASEAARSRAETEASSVRQLRSQAEAAPQQAAPAPADTQAASARARLLEDLGDVLSTRDTPRGLVVTVPETAFSGESLAGAASAQLARVAAILARYPGLHVSVEGHTAVAGGQALSQRRAEAARTVLISNGVAPSAVSATGFSNSRPLGPGAKENSRVEIVLSGGPIGTRPLWERNSGAGQ